MNRRDLLEWTLRSVRRQSYYNVEHIVVDGGSTDGTVEMLAEFGKTYQLRWTSEPDGGIYNAINKGFRMANGTILAYLNSDDLYFPWTVDTVVRSFQSHRRSDLVIGDALKIDETTGRQEIYWTRPFDLDYVRRVGFLVQPTVFMRKAVFDEVGPFDESIRYVADCDFWMRAGSAHDFFKVDELLAIERNHPLTAREVHGERVWDELSAVRSRYVRLTGARHEQLLRQYGIKDRLWRRVYWSMFLLTASIPAALRPRRWREYIQSGHSGVDRPRLLLSLVPWVGRRVAGTVQESSRYWLQPQG
jgi:glycosyltransferase involved in cell wall biosynthesis